MNLCGFEVGLDKPIFLISGPAWPSPSRCAWTSPAR